MMGTVIELSLVRFCEFCTALTHDNEKGRIMSDFFSPVGTFALLAMALILGLVGLMVVVIEIRQR